MFMSIPETHQEYVCPGNVVKQFHSDVSFSLAGWINKMFLNLLYYIFANVGKADGRYRFI